MTELFGVSPEQTDKGMGLKLCFVRAVFFLCLCVFGGEGIAFQFSSPISETSAYLVTKLGTSAEAWTEDSVERTSDP